MMKMTKVMTPEVWKRSFFEYELGSVSTSIYADAVRVLVI